MKRTLAISSLSLVMLAGSLTVVHVQAKPTPKPSPSKSATASPRPSVSASPKATRSATPKPSKSSTPKPTPSKTKTPTPKPSTSKSPSPKPTNSKSPTPKPSSSPSSSPSASPKPKPTPKPIVLPSTVPNPPARVTGVDQVLKYAMLQTGKKYVLGGVGPNTFDCSGLVQTAWKKIGVNLPRTSGQQFDATIHIDMEDALPGDLIFYGQNGKQHVAIYIGFGLIVEAANPKRGVVISPIDTPWHHKNFGGVGRVTKN